MTVSEDLFVRFCTQRRIHSERIATAEHLAERRPDFRVLSRRRRARAVLVEIKEVVPTNEERKQIERFEREGRAEFSATPGKKIRSFIGTGARQLRALADASTPAVIVVHEPSGLLGQHIDPYSVLTAMRGFDEVPVSVPASPAESPRFGPMRIGGSRQLTPTANTTVSAIALLKRRGPRATQLEVYHNPHARCPLRLRELGGGWVWHFRMRQDQQGWRLVSCS